MPSPAAQPARSIDQAARFARLRLKLADFAEELMILGQFALGRDWSANVIDACPAPLNFKEGMELPSKAIEPDRRAA